MVTSIDKISGSFLTAKNENVFALANLNFDFSLVKVAAPPEYASLGTALTRRRQEEAESGVAHQTARKLGALFEATVPDTPLLLAAYGKRATHIVETPGANPTGSSARHGPFADYVGVDATSIWAAATSGPASIAVHFLACLLARAFEDPAVATSIWVELVAGRQRELRESLDSGGNVIGFAQIAAANAAGQRIPRDELRQWDASARAWLQTADAAMAREHAQFQLIIKNISMAVSSAAALYANVRGAWTGAMTGLERLLAGESLGVSSGAVLLAMSSWHLYPRLTVLSSPVKTIETTDELMKTAGVATVGIMRAATEGDEDGIYWSVALSHFRYYGKPVDIVGTPDDRLSISELHLVAFGSLLRVWGIGRREDPEPVARWLGALWECVDKVKSSLARPQWLKLLASAATELLDASDAHKRHCMQLIDFGHRRGDDFLGVKCGHASLPWFGLRSRHILSALSQDSPAECAIQYLREICAYSELGPDDALITWISPSSKVFRMHLYASAVRRRHVELRDVTAAGREVDDQLPALQPDALPRKGKKRQVMDEKKTEEVITYKHCRWLGYGDASGDKIVTPSAGTKVQKRGESTYVTSMKETIRRFESNLRLGYDDIEASEKAVRYSLADGSYPIRWPEPQGEEKVHSLGSLMQTSGLVSGGNGQQRGAGVLLPAWGTIHTGLKEDGASSGPLAFTAVLNSSQDFFRLWFADMSTEKTEWFEKRLRGLQEGEPGSLLPLAESTKQLISGVSPSLLWQFFEGTDPYDPIDFAKPVLDLMETERHAILELLRPLRNLALATDIYAQLEGATISSRIVTTGIANPYWRDTGTLPTRSQVFSCIAMMETGVVNLEAEGMEQILGLSSGNSLFVLSQLLSDPGKHVNRAAVTRLAGNVGRPGVSLLALPAASPLVRPLSPSYRAVQYRNFDGRWEDNFYATSLHLSFTKHEMPIDYGARGVIDHQVFLVECVVSVHDGPEWVTDLDVLAAFDEGLVPTLQRPSKRCGGCCELDRPSVAEEMRRQVTTADSWEEVLDAPPGLTIVRARGNWSARLAIASYLAAQGSGKESGGSKSAAVDKGVNGFVVLEAEGEDCNICIYRRLRQYVKRHAALSLPFYVVV